MKEIRVYGGEQPPEPGLYYVMDPMCSWCWAYQPVVNALLESDRLSSPLIYLLGGLAPDSDEPMPATMQQYLQQTWRQIEQQTGTPFNHAFWTQNQPRRSTYPACRAVLAAERLIPGSFAKMAAGIQEAYYQQAKNPSDESVLTDVATAIGCNTHQFAKQLHAEETQKALMAHLHLKDRSGVQGFPSLVYWHRDEAIPISYGYTDLPATLKALAGNGYPSAG